MLTPISKLLFSFLLATQCAFFCVEAQLPARIPFRRGEEWGYCNASKEVIIPTTFDRTFPFIGGMAAVRAGNKYFFIDSTGKTLGDFVFESATPNDPEILALYASDDIGSDWHSLLTAGLFSINVKNAKGISEAIFVNKKGNIAFKERYEEAGNFVGGRALVRKAGKYGYIDTNGKVVVPIKLKEKPKEGTSTSLGHILSTEQQRPSPFQAGSIYGYILNGTVIIKPRYKTGGAFIGGLAMVTFLNVENELRQGYIAPDGTEFFEE